MSFNINKLLNLIYTNKCALCRIPCDDALCQKCMHDLNRLEFGCCHGCGKSIRKCICKKKKPFERCISAFNYAQPSARALIFKLKNNGNRNVVNFLCDAVFAQIKREYSTVKFDAITYVPISKSKLYYKGFDHAQLLSKKISKMLGVPCVKPPIKRGGKVGQKTLEKSERMSNAKQAFKLKKGSKISGCILLIDDVITTGSTIYRCSELLIKAGADSVYCATAATT